MYDIEVEDTIKEDGTLYPDNDWHTVLEEQVTAEIGDNLDIRLFLPVRAVDIGIGDKRGKFSCRCCIGTLGEIGSTIVEGKYELPDHGDQIPVVMCITRKNIEVQNPYIRIQLRNDDYTVQQIRIDCADRDGQFSIIKILKRDFPPNISLLRKRKLNGLFRTKNPKAVEYMKDKLLVDAGDSRGFSQQIEIAMSDYTEDTLSYMDGMGIS